MFIYFFHKFTINMKKVFIYISIQIHIVLKIYLKIGLIYRLSMMNFDGNEFKNI